MADFSDLLKHLRLIHFSLVVATATVAYLLFDAWSDAPQVLNQAREFERFVAELSAESPAPEKVNPTWAATYFDGTRLGDVLQASPFNEHTYRFVYRSPLDTTQAIATIADKIDASYVLEIRVLAEPMSASAFDEERRKHFGTPLPRLFALFYQCSLTYNSVWRDEDPVSVRFTRVCHVVGEDRLGSSGPIISSFAAAFRTRVESVAAGRDWRGGFAALLSKPSLTRRDPEYVVSKTEEELTALLEGKLSLAGIEFERAHVGFVGPLILLALLAYLGIFLGEALRQAQARSASSAPVLWVGAMASRMARLVAWSTIFLLPPAVSATALYRLVRPRWWVLVIALALWGAAGWLAAARAEQVARALSPARPTPDRESTPADGS